ncbi:hypothetical protein ACWOFR_09980 [Carnobacterium gallinarum]|uniref:hypothetical protein n=1 Tax=Carnobacterium gallinarum TaxID=2749 RepID=UPI000557F1F1|nr:hypothetical protein [Carnobacterium gallinarum]
MMIEGQFIPEDTKLTGAYFDFTNLKKYGLTQDSQIYVVAYDTAENECFGTNIYQKEGVGSFY